jgi:mannose-6-phosphate isomerase-like protein (cupin superfamily)
MTTTGEKYLIRKLSETPEERGVCGWRRTLVTHEDTPVANVSHLRIDDSRKHYHREMTEFYYVLSGGGTITLDGETSRCPRASSSSSSRGSGTRRTARWTC